MKFLIVTIMAITLSGCGLLQFGADDRETAYIYENRETGKLLFCSNDQGNNVRDFKYIGTGEVATRNVKFCSLEKN